MCRAAECEVVIDQRLLITRDPHGDTDRPRQADSDPGQYLFGGPGIQSSPSVAVQSSMKRCSIMEETGSHGYR